MKYLAAALLMAGLTLSSAAAYTPGGISGHIVDVKTGKPLAGVPLEIYRMPIKSGDLALVRLKTNDRGFFVKNALPIGRYMVAALADGRSFGCIVDDVYDTSMTNMTLGVGEDNTVCSGPRVHSGLVNANVTADLTTIR
jgi:hypothetical protein